MTPPDLAIELGLDPKRLRDWLRATYPAQKPGKGGRWSLTDDMVRAARAQFGGTRTFAGQTPSPASPSPLVRAKTTTGHGLHHPVMHAANAAGINLALGSAVPGLMTNGHASSVLREHAPSAMTSALRRIFEDLGGDSEALNSKKPMPISPDLVHVPTGTLIEVDEEQHFTTARLKALQLYPSDTQLGFDLGDYISTTEQWIHRGDRAFAHKTAREFPGRGGRQAQRAYLDAVRDLLAPQLTGQPVIRIAVPDRNLSGALDVLRFQLAKLGY